MPDAVIIGAGPAGSVASILLARRGWRVTLLEQHRFPRDKVCGECLSALGIDVLSRLGLADDIASLQPVRLRRSIFVAPSGETATFDLPREMWGLPRSVMDERLMTAARDAGVFVQDLHRCEDVQGGVCPIVRARDLRTNEIREFSPQVVIIADGKAALGETRPDMTGEFGLKAHFAGIDAPADAIVLLGARGHYVGVASIGHDRWNVAMSVGQPCLRACDGDGDRVLDLMKSENIALAQMFRSATRFGDWLAAPLPRFGVAKAWSRRVIPVGNAAAALEPIGGEGMGLAMRSAELAATAIDAAQRRNEEPDAGALRRAYHRLWKTRSRACRAAAWAISSPTFADIAVQAAASSDVVARLGMMLVGKSRSAQLDLGE
ncbi:MAG: NAD(P)/FAD-dependent oxidoreductase [Planctomycetota bacterium]|nr:NAD(P)/FAD-dependent oxidoreductase [Planctomycetota bacterium]